MSDEPVDYEDLTSMQLDADALAALVEPGGECIFNWTNSQGYPVGVVVAYVWRDGRFWTTCADRRKRVPALKQRPQSGIVINRGGKTASYKGDSIVHANGDPGFDELKELVLPTRCRASRRTRTTTTARRSSKFLDSPHRVIIETEANLVVAFDTVKFAAVHQRSHRRRPSLTSSVLPGPVPGRTVVSRGRGGRRRRGTSGRRA